MSDLTVLIQGARQGDLNAERQLFDLLYRDLHRIARARLARGGRNTLLDTTSLVNEAYLRLARAKGMRAEDRNSYLAYASRAMRSVIVDMVRASETERRGGAVDRVTLNTELSDNLSGDETEITRVHEALEELASIEPRIVRVVEMCYFAGLSHQEVAQALGVTERTVRRDWEKARMLLAVALR
jgi:RNA polymerase sigma factor (TIGR02999 family)